MWSYSSCAKQHHKYTKESRRFFFLKQSKIGCTLYPELRDKERALPMVLDTARLRYKENTIWLGLHGRDGARKSTPKVNILQVFTIDFSEIQSIVNHNSQSDGQNNSAKRWMNLQKKTIHIISLQQIKIIRTNSFQRKREDTRDNGIFL